MRWYFRRVVGGDGEADAVSGIRHPNLHGEILTGKMSERPSRSSTFMSRLPRSSPGDETSSRFRGAPGERPWRNPSLASEPNNPGARVGDQLDRNLLSVLLATNALFIQKVEDRGRLLLDKIFEPIGFKIEAGNVAFPDEPAALPNHARPSRR